MSKLLAPRRISRLKIALTLTLAATGIVAAALPAAASASSSQITIIQDYSAVGYGTISASTLQEFRTLGATTVRIFVPWESIAPHPRSLTAPKHFNASNPSSYPARNWAAWDTLVQTARTDGLTLDLVVAPGAPRWAEHRVPVPGGWNQLYAYYPSARQYGQFMTAIARRYSGHYTPPRASKPLPGVHFWTIWNEPNFGEDLGPQATGGSRQPVAPMLYRQILNAGWKALRSTGHGRDTILIGGFAARGQFGGKYPGDFGQTPPLRFIRYLYCVDQNFNQLRGSAAGLIGCPTSGSASRRFRSQNPALFNASGVADHPYPSNGSPINDGKGNPDYATFPDLGNLGRELDRVVRVYGSRTRFPIYNDEYGYITSPPARAGYLSPAKAAVDINWAEYLSYKNPRIKSYMQYLLQDPPRTAGKYAGFASGLRFPNGSKKVTYYAFNLPVYMPTTSFSHGQNVEVWGDARPANDYGSQSLRIQFQPGGQGAFTTLNTVTTRSNGYFDIRMKFPSSGNVRLSYTYPITDPLLPLGVAGSTILSRSFAVTVH